MNNQDHVSGGVQSVEAVSLADLVEDAGNRTGHARMPMVSDDDISVLQSHCRDFIEKAHLSHHTYMMAMPKLDEMIFWIRAGHGKG